MKHVRFYRAGTWPSMGGQPVFHVEAGGVHPVTDAFGDAIIAAGKGEECAAIQVSGRVEPVATYDDEDDDKPEIGPDNAPLIIGPDQMGEKDIAVPHVEHKPRRRRKRKK